MLTALLVFLLAKPVSPPPFRVGGDVKAPISIKRIEPNIDKCLGRPLGSTISILEAVIDKEGRVRDLKILKRGDVCLTDAAVKAIRQWRFKPGTLNGKPVDVIYNLTVNPHFR